MREIGVHEAQRTMAALIEELAASHEPLTIVGERGKAVLVSEDDWRSAEETLCLLSIRGMRKSIREGMAEPLSGCSKHLAWP